MLYWLRVLADLLASGGGATTATPLSSTAKGYEDAHIDCSQDGQQSHGKPRSDLHGRVQSSPAYILLHNYIVVKSHRLLQVATIIISLEAYGTFLTEYCIVANFRGAKKFFAIFWGSTSNPLNLACVNAQKFPLYDIQTTKHHNMSHMPMRAAGIITLG